MKKKIFGFICLIVVLAAAVSLAACNKGEEYTNDNTALLKQFDGATVQGKTVALDVAPDVEAVSVGEGAYRVEVSVGCRWALYRDVACQIVMQNNRTDALKEGHNRYYLLVSTEDGTISNKYSLDIWRNFYATVNYYAADKLVQTETVLSHTAFPVPAPINWIGYDFSGWNLEGRVVENKIERIDADISPKPEMSNFEFSATDTTCVVTGVKDKNAESIVVPDYVTRIRGLAFSACTKVVRMKIPFIGETEDGENHGYFGYIFGAENGMMNSEWVPDSLMELEITGGSKIAAEAFYGCDRLVSVTLPSEIKSIDRYAFYGCSQIERINLPAALQQIGYRAFYGCARLRSVAIPNAVTGLGVEAFYGCDGLKSVDVGGGINTLGNSAFAGCKGMTSLTLRSGIKGIADMAFAGCESLSAVTIPDSVKAIGNFAFENCAALFDVKLGSGVTTLGNGVFKDCVSLEGLTVPQNVTTIGSDTFSGCRSLVSVQIPNAVTSLNLSHMFQNCENLVDVSLPTGIEEIGELAFYNCKSLTDIRIPSGVLAIGASAFAHSGLTAVSLPNGVIRLGSQAFFACTDLNGVILPASLSEVGNAVFTLCVDLQTINCKGDVQPEGWDADWLSGCDAAVVWGYLGN